MILSSCVADSLLLSLDSAGQALGTGTNSSPLSSSQPLALAMCVVKPDELGMLGEGKRPADLWEKSLGASPWREQKRDMCETLFQLFYKCVLSWARGREARAGGCR